MPDKILIVDDEPKIRKLCSEALRRAGYEVSVAKDAKTALNIIDKKPFDLILLDIVMPEIDGLELLKLIKKKQEDLIVIMITGYASIETSVKAKKSGAYDYIKKPFSINEIRSTVKKALEYKNLIGTR